MDIENSIQFALAYTRGAYLKAVESGWDGRDEQNQIDGAGVVIRSLGYEYAFENDKFAYWPKDNPQKMRKFRIKHDGFETEELKESRRPRRRVLREEYEDDYDKESLIKKGKKAIKAISPEQFESDVEWLWKNKEGCVHYKLFDTENYEYDLCIGWSDGEDEEAPYADDYYIEGTYEIVAGFRRQPFNNGMQADLDLDFEIPWNENEKEENSYPFDNATSIRRDAYYPELLWDFEDDVENLIDAVL